VFLYQKILSSQATTPIQPHPPLSPPPVTTVETEPSVENAFFATAAAPISSKPVTPVPTKSSNVSSSNTSTTDINDWSNLPFSSIKRKPISEIVAYLQAKGRNVIGEDGKPLPKSKLLEAIYSI
jgi:hypothetical protein